MKVRLRKYEGCWNDDGKLDGVIGQHCPNVRVVSVGVKKIFFFFVVFDTSCSFIFPEFTSS